MAEAPSSGGGQWRFDSSHGHVVDESKDAPKGEWEMTDHAALQAAIARLSHTPEWEVRNIEKRWRSMRKRALNPAEMIGWKY